ncbi:hypothetical protein [Nocardia sp. NPDC046763]
MSAPDNATEWFDYSVYAATAGYLTSAFFRARGMWFGRALGGY